MTKFKHYQSNLNHFLSLFWLIGFLTCGVAAPTFAAEKLSDLNAKITGKVVDFTDNVGMPGVNVLVKGTQKGTFTDGEGNYTLDNVDANTILVFSFIGYKSQEVAINGRSIINVKLQEDTKALDEVVVIGYGSAKKVTLSGSVEQVKAEVFEDRAVSNVALALQGQTPGLVINRTSSRPGNEGINLQIRGATSLNGGSPLIVVDGAPVFDNSEFYQMNPDDIESISVLKDGAASIYGSRAANGVILVTTKKGKGKMKVEFNSMFRANYLGLRPPVPSYEEYGQLWLDAAAQDTTPFYWNWGEDVINAFASGKSGFLQTPTTVWGYNGLIYMAPANRYDDLYGNNTGHQESISLAGSSDKARYRLSMSWAESQGALKVASDGLEQYSVRLNTDFDISKRLKLGANIALQKNITSSPSSSFGQALVSQDAPVFPAKNPQGQWYANFGNAGGTNSIAGIANGGRDNLVSNTAKLSFNLTYDLGHGFSANATATNNLVTSRQDITSLNVLLYNWNGEKANNSINQNPNIVVTSINKTYQTYGSFLNYQKSLGKHNMQAMVGLTAEKNDYQSLTGRRFGIVDEGVYDLDIATGVQENSGGQRQEGLYSYLSRVNYDFEERFLIELVGRRDGSSRFAPGFKFNNYGSASVGWNLYKEQFIENLGIFSNLKLRASIGSSGNQVGIGPYDYVSTIGTGTELFGEGGTLSATSFINGLTTTTRTWEDVIMKNVGLDFALFNDKLSGAFDTYERKNNGMLISVTYPEVLGANAPATNSGNLVTKGWEAMLNWKDNKGGVSYNIGINMSNNNNKLVYLAGGNSIQQGLRNAVEGYPLNSYFVWETDGFFKSQEEVNAYNALYNKAGSEVPTGASALRAGDSKKVDLDGNGLINDQNANDPNGKGQGDVKFAGDAQAHYVFGINLGAKYKGFDFTSFFQGALQQVVSRAGVNNFPFNNPWPNQTTAYNGLMWTPENPDADFPRLTAQRNLARWNWADSDIHLQNGRYMRLKTIVLGYTLPTKVLNKLKAEKIRVYVSGNDLFEFSSLIDGFDPESGADVSVSSSNDQRSIYPFQRTVAVGINIGF